MGEDGEFVDDPDGAWEISVEAKSFSCYLSEGKFILKESHQRWVRSLSLSWEQISWIGRVLIERSNSVGVLARKESSRFVDGEISVTEGRNYWGSFIAVQLLGNQSKPSFLTFPAGSNGSQWQRVSQWIRGKITKETGSEWCKQPTNQPIRTCSFANAVRFGPVIFNPYSEFLALQGQIAILSTKLEAALTELSELRSSISYGTSVEYGGTTFGVAELAAAENGTGGDKLDTVSKDSGDCSVQKKAGCLQEDDDVGDADYRIQILNLDQNLTSSEMVSEDRELSVSHACFERVEDMGLGFPQKITSLPDKTKDGPFKKKNLRQCVDKSHMPVLKQHLFFFWIRQRMGPFSKSLKSMTIIQKSRTTGQVLQWRTCRGI